MLEDPRRISSQQGPWWFWKTQFYTFHYIIDSVQFSYSVVSNSLRPHGTQHARPPCPSPIPRVYPNSCPLSQWCHPTISSSVIPLSSCPQSFPASGSFQMSQLFPSGGQRIGVSASTSVLPMNTEDWFPLRWTGWISLQSNGFSKVFSNTTVQKHQFFGTWLSLESNSPMNTQDWSPLGWTFINRFFSSSSLSFIRVVSSAYLRLLIFLLAFLITACALSNLTIHVSTLHIS